MKRVLRYSGLFVLIVMAGLCLTRAIVGLSFVMGDHVFYPPAGQFLRPDVRTAHFVILSDSGSANHTLERVIREAKNQHHPDFMLYLGDLVTSRTTEHLFWMVNEIASRLDETPMYFAIGNHDCKKRSGMNKSYYRHVFSQPYYWFGYGDTLFITLDSASLTISDDEWAFFEQVMQRIRPSFRRVILYTHVPPTGNHALKPEASAKMAEMLSRYPVDAIFTGHVHYFSRQNFNGIPLYTNPSSGQRPRGDIPKFGYTDVVIDENGIHVTPYYSNQRKASEWAEKFFVDNVLTDRFKWIVLWGIFGGILLIWFGCRDMRHPFRKRHK